MYLTTPAVPGKPPVMPYRAVSADGERWRLEPATPLLVPSAAPDAFDRQSIETPSVVRLRGRYHLYYTGVSQGLGGPMAIGHATSPDGVRWERDPASPVVRPTGRPADFSGLQVAEPGAVVYRGRVYLYFAAVGLRARGTPKTKRVIALAVSSDGSRFGAPRVVLEQGARYPPTSGFDGYSAPAALVRGGRVHLFYDVGLWQPDAAPAWTQVAIHHASSPDGVGRWVEDGAPIVTRAESDWTAMEVRAPAPLVDGSVLRLWFAGNGYPGDFAPQVRKTGRTRLFGIGEVVQPIRRTR